ncbi:uncharacterized protein LOC129595669 [Paramacrobiotus metropolitanus]|uniref:uncharacterized protein LOC129595669 n=1 Tax=Paramacrobiotus metropolitanus TaxID=2943436 RepID=UPI0024456CE3|nr:uncharacterized protein LOC129595669 [Paramacrobiotus metropolitanus]
MNRINQKVLIYTFISFVTNAFCENNLGRTADLEADCSVRNQSVTSIPFSLQTVPSFRNDTLTMDECIAYHARQADALMCAIVWELEMCALIGDVRRQYTPMLNTYIQPGCKFQERMAVETTTRAISLISPDRAVALALWDWNGPDDPVTSEVVEPVRQQIIALDVHQCYTYNGTSNVTSKIHSLGLLPNLHSLEIVLCFNMTVKRDHFSRMPRVRMITFTMSTMVALEAGTFTDLPFLWSLVLEKDFVSQLQHPFPKPKEGASDNDVAFYRWKKSEEDCERDYLQRLHCDCSFAWLRNLFRKKPYLIFEKNAGEVFAIGNYLSPVVSRQKDSADVLSVDCSQNLTVDNYFMGHEFSYNTVCSNRAC